MEPVQKENAILLTFGNLCLANVVEKDAGTAPGEGNFGEAA